MQSHNEGITPEVITGRAKGGYARAEQLTAAQRREIAKRAAASRWAAKQGILRATHTGDLTIAGVSIPCAVLEDGTRVIWQQGFLRAIGRTGRAQVSAMADQDSSELPIFLRADNLKPFISDDLITASNPIVFRPLTGPPISVGYRADLLPRVCSVFIDAGEAEALRRNQWRIYERSKLLIRGFAIVGITALVDEATGYQEVRDRLALQQILDAYIGKELAKWVRTFPQDFYEQIFRLKGWSFDRASSRRLKLMANLTVDLVYRRLAPGVLAKLRELSPKDEHGRRRSKLFQWLTTDIGHPALKEHLSNITFLAKSHDDWDGYYKAVNRVAPKFGDTLPLPFPEEEPVLIAASSEPEPLSLLSPSA